MHVALGRGIEIIMEKIGGGLGELFCVKSGNLDIGGLEEKKNLNNHEAESVICGFGIWGNIPIFTVTMKSEVLHVKKLCDQ